MNKEESLELIKECIESVSPGSSEEVTTDTNLIEDGILDSLDAMSFIFEIEKKIGTKLSSITEQDIDLLVSSLIDEISV